MTEKKDQGYTMIIVMCLMFLFMALALSMLFSSALLLSRAERAGMQKQSRASAVSFTEWMDKELANGSAASGLCNKIQERIYNTDSGKRWPSYNPDLIGHEAAVAVLKFEPDTTSAPDMEKLGDLEVSMYWETEDGRAYSNNDMEDNVYLVVTVKAVVKDEQYSITTRYIKHIADSGEGPWDGKWSLEGRE